MPEELTEAGFLEAYDHDTVVRLGGFVTTLGVFLENEDVCPVDDDKMRDPAVRIRKLARVIAAGSHDALHEEHRYLLEQSAE